MVLPDDRSAAILIAIESFKEVDIGFSHQTCLPAFKAAIAICPWVSFGGANRNQLYCLVINNILPLITLT